MALGSVRKIGWAESRKSDAALASVCKNQLDYAVSRIGGLLGIAVLGTIIVHSFNGELDRRLARMDITPEVRRSIDEQRVRLAGAKLPSSIDARTRLALKQAIDESFVFG
ncbi:MAG: hypothetical protein ACREQW_02980, partial [Candidatus Binatia bacterium]